MTSLHTAVIASLLLLGACASDEKCDSTEACIPFADLSVSAVSIESSGGVHPVTGKRVVDRTDSLRVTYTIKNLGRLASDSSHVTVYVDLGRERPFHTDTIPPVAGGASLTRTVTLPTKSQFFGGPLGSPTDLITADVEVTPHSSENTTNNQTSSDTVHLALPVIVISAPPLSVQAVRAGDPMTMSVTVTNASLLAPARDIKLIHCLVHYDSQCGVSTWTAFGDIAIPDLMPGESRTINYTASVSPTAYIRGYSNLHLMLCVRPRSDTTPYPVFAGPPGYICTGVSPITVWTNHDVCNPPSILGVPAVTLSQPNCGFYPLPEQFPQYTKKHLLYYVFALDAEPGVVYRITGGASADIENFHGLPATDLDPAQDRVMFAQGGRHYFIIAAQQGTYSMSAEAVN